MLGVGASVGFLLHWLLPEVSLGTTLLIGVVATGISTHFFARMTASMRTYEEEDEHAERRPITLYAIEPPRSPRRRKKPDREPDNDS